MTPIFDELVDGWEESWRQEARWTTCPWCRGYGIVNGYEGQVKDCYKCGGSGLDYARDAHGRFTTLWFTDTYKEKRDYIRWLRSLARADDIVSKMYTYNSGTNMTITFPNYFMTNR